MNQIIKLFLIAVAVVTAIPSYAVSDREMEQARTLAAKHYLRYANNGSDYLDKLSPSTMAELTKHLKAKELENIKSFNAVPVPKDYASWDKARLVEYWSKTFFKSPGLKEDGKKCLGILGKNIGKMEVKAPAAPAAKEPEKPAEKTSAPSQSATAAQQQAAAPAVADTPAASGDAQSAAAQAEAEAQVAAEDVDLQEERPKKESGTIYYVIFLILLIGVVIWLVMYAQKSMKETNQIVSDHRNGDKEIREAKRAAKEEVNKMRDQYAASISAKNEEIKQLRAKCGQLEEEVESLKQQLARKAAAPAPQPQPRRQAPSMEEPHDHAEAPKAAAAQRQQTVLPPMVYLGYVNQRGLFVKASRSLNEETSVYRMDIPDGMHGTFRVVNEASVLDRLLSDPEMWLAGGCEIENPGDADIATEIVTISPGEAVFSDNTCRVTVKARIKFI